MYNSVCIKIRSERNTSSSVGNEVFVIVFICFYFQVPRYSSQFFCYNLIGSLSVILPDIQFHLEEFFKNYSGQIEQVAIKSKYFTIGI